MASTRRSLLPDIKFTHHSPASSDRRYVDSYGTLLTADGTSPTVVKRVDTTPRSSFSEHQNGNDTVEPTSSVMGATFNLANGIVGAGIVGLPYALNQGGFFFGITTICFCCYLTHYTVTLMIETGRAHGRFSYEELCEQAFGKTGFYVLSLFQLFNSFGACCVYILVISTTLPSVTALYLGTVQFWLFDNVSVITILTSLSILLPLSLHRNMSHLEKWSFLSLCTVIILATIVTMTFLSEEKMSSYAIENATTMLYDIHNDWAPSVGIIAFAFGCQQYSFIVFSTLQNPNRRRWWCVSASGTIVALILSLCVGIFGYFRYGSSVLPNVLNNMKADGVLANITRVVLALTMCFTFPLDFFVVRYTIQRAIQRCTKDKWDGDEPYQLGNSNRNGQILAFSPVFTRSNLRGKGHASDLKLCYHFIFTSTVWIVCLCTSIISIKYGGLGVVLQLTGSIGTIFTAFVFPTATFIRLGTNDSLHPDQSLCCCCLTPNMFRLLRYVFAWFVLFFGLVSGCIASYVTVRNAAMGGAGGSSGHNNSSTPSSS